MKPTTAFFPLLFAASLSAPAREFHVSPTGRDAGSGTATAPLRTIQRAANLAQPGDVITVHAGTYRERINPPRGGNSDSRRITYQAAPGERVELKGSEVIKSWARVQGDVWQVTLPNSHFAGFNPYADHIHGDWFNPLGRPHHTGAVYLNGDWLTEAAKLEEVLMPAGSSPAWLRRASQDYLLNVAWLRPGDGTAGVARTPATSLAARQGTQNAPCSEGGECLGFISHGDWVSYERMDFGQGSGQMEIRAAAAGEGGIIELRLDAPDGELLGACLIPNTGGWQSWASFKAGIKPVSGSRTLCLVFRSRQPPALNSQLWYGQVDATNTTLWAQFKGVNPNDQLVEINVRQTVFYPDAPGRNFITVRGFTLRHAATPWAPPTAEQVGLIGTHWSRGWIIESNVISHSVCSGIALGKHGDTHDNTSADTAEGYVKTIERAHAHPIAWTKANIGRHVVRNNTISHCEQAGIVGSLGAAFSTVTGNVIHDIHVRRLFTGAEMAGIKFHGAIDTTIQGNRIYRTCRGLWLDWMAQGTRVSGNLFCENASEDLFVEVDHGPFVVDNNLFLSPTSLLDMSEGGAYVHNLFAGKLVSTEEPGRQTPFHPAHETRVAGLSAIKGGDNRFYNNLFIGTGSSPGEAVKPDNRHRRVAGYGLWVYDAREFPLATGGNVFYHGSQPYFRETNHVVRVNFDPALKFTEGGGPAVFHFTLSPEVTQARTVPVTTGLLGRARIPGLPYENADGSPLKIATDYLGRQRSKTNPSPGPFEVSGAGSYTLTVWQEQRLATP